MVFSILLDDLIASLRTPSGVRHINITNEEEMAIVNPNTLPTETLRLAGLLPIDKLKEASRDIKQAYEDLSGNVLIARRARLTSNNTYWLAFWSVNSVISPSAPLINVRVKDLEFAKLLALYFNSAIAFLQLLAFSAETEGAWVALHGKQVWSHIYVPSYKALNKEKREKMKKIFDSVSKVDVKPIYQRITKHDSIQRVIDELALEMLGLEDWKPRLDEIYDALAEELETMHKILETSRRQTNRTKAKKEKEETAAITRWLGEAKT